MEINVNGRNNSVAESIKINRTIFNDDLISKNIAVANKVANKNIASIVNLVADNNLSNKNLLNDPKVQEFIKLSRTGRTQEIRKIYSQDRFGSVVRNVKVMNNSGKLFDSTFENIKDLDLDHVLPYSFLFSEENEDLLMDVLVSYNGDVEAAMSDLMIDNPQNFVFVSKHINRSKGGNLGSDVSNKYSKLSESERASVESTYRNLESDAKAYATKNAENNRFNSTKDQFLKTARNIAIVYLLKILLRMVTNKLMEITGKLLMKDTSKKYLQVLKDACKTDSIKKFCKRIYESLKSLKSIVKEEISKVIDYFNDGRALSTKIAETVKTLLVQGAIICITSICDISKLFFKAIQAGWAIANLVKQLIKTIKNKKIKNYEVRLNNAKNLANEIVRSICDTADFAFELVLNVFFSEVKIDALVRPLVNIILFTLCSFITFIIRMIIDATDSLMVNAAKRVKYSIENSFN